MTERTISLNTGTVTFGFRLFYPELHPPPADAAPAARAQWRFYGAIRTGGALSENSHLFDGITTEPAESVLGTRFATLLGAGIGVDYGRCLGLEASFENYGLTLTTPTPGVIGKYSVSPILLQGRLRYPLLDNRLEPYLLAGAGAEVAEPDKPNDNALGVYLLDP